MRRSFLFLLAVLGLLPQLHAGEPLQIRVLSYNIHHGQGVDHKLDLERIAKVIQSVKPDLVALQEVDQYVTRSRNVDQPKELAKLTGMQVAFGKNIDLQGGAYGNAVFSKFPIKTSKNHRLPNVDNGEHRGVLDVDITLPNAPNTLRLLATHFDHRSNDQERVQSAKAINKLIRKDDRPALLMGDLNDVNGSETLKILESEWQRTNDKPLPTVPVKSPTRQIDFILYRSAKRWKVVETRVLDEAIASDHRAIFSLLELQPE